MGAFTPVQRFLLARGHGRKARRRERWVTRSFSPERCFGLTSLLDPLTFMRRRQSGPRPSRTHPQCLHRAGAGEIPTEQPVPLLLCFCPASLIEQGQCLHMTAAARRNAKIPHSETISQSSAQVRHRCRYYSPFPFRLLLRWLTIGTRSPYQLGPVRISRRLASSVLHPDQEFSSQTVPSTVVPTLPIVIGPQFRHD